VDEILETVVEERHSRIPVYESTIDHIIGILHIKDMFALLSDYFVNHFEASNTNQPINLSEIIANRPPFFTPESKKIKDLLQELRANKQRMAIIVDEYGGTAGLLTTEDIIEEIVGEIQDEDEIGEEGFEIQYVVDAKTDVSELNEFLGINLPIENCKKKAPVNGVKKNSLEKFIVDFWGKNPEIEETFEYQNLQFSILESSEAEILSVGIIKKWDGNIDAATTTEIQPEFKADKEWLQLRYLVDARMDIHELNELLETNLASESVDTIGGFIIDMLGQVPEKDRSFEYQGLQFSILEADERRILRLAIVKNS
jgi:CBS domain containing-hemolysin-like protein